MAVTAEAVKVLRERTGAGMMECKKALVETNGDLDAAAELMRKSGLAKADKKASRIAAEGVVVIERSGDGRRAAVVEVNCETDFVARTDDFQNLVKELAMQIAAANPRFVRREDVPESVVEQERAIFAAQAKESGKPAAVIDKMVVGKLEKFYADVCLLEQPFIKDPDKAVHRLITDAGSSGPAVDLAGDFINGL